ncbi:polysaccharide deacetylase family protein [Chondromyces crocatus]|uniref:Polysaccharide deacetylase n=1 Tax=Chondromyces crocatus TaxID=52 RepID=A0A0K1ECA3_CHOCO|nr:polysaccharide deacetylase family protein [Chondromyces crocatus]AKT38312.1 polysaccharide deacetylase [Chondromyces crocatus]
MSPPLAILSYHRVLPDTGPLAEGWPYVRRGTAVSLGSFARQIEQLTRHCALVDEATVCAWAHGQAELERPSVWLTFDDGYRDVVDHALPVLDASGVTATVFVTTCTLEAPPGALPADRWYAALTRARQSRGELAVNGSRWSFDLSQTDDRMRLVDGPERRHFLYASQDEQASILRALGHALGGPTEPAAGLYLSGEALRRLVQRGWTVGAHGATHTPFPVLTSAALAAEFDDQESAFARHGLPRPTALAYPDAAWSAAAEAELTRRGYRTALLLGDRRAQKLPLRLGRFLVPDDPHWVQRVLLPALEGDG